MDLKSKEFEKLQAEWDAKLKKSGFDDKERRDGCLKFYDSDYFTSNITGADPVYYKSKEEYYRMAGKFLYDNKFKSQQDKIIWEQHAEGKSIREIVKILRKKGFKSYKRKVHETIQPW
jgi:hypothetical protein